MARSRATARKAYRCPECQRDRFLLHAPRRGTTICRRCAAGFSSVAAARKLLAIPLRQRIESNAAVDPTTGCWVWTGHTYSNGYAAISWLGRQRLAHRLAYSEYRGAIPAGLQLDHLCRVRACVNPDHLEPVTARENTRRAMRTHCVHGHPFSPENTYVPADGKRYCRTCRRDRNRAAKAVA